MTDDRQTPVALRTLTPAVRDEQRLADDDRADRVDAVEKGFAAVRLTR